MGKRRPRNKGSNIKRYKMFAGDRSAINSGPTIKANKQPNPIAMEQYYNSAKTLGDKDFKDHPPTTKQTINLNNGMQYNEVTRAMRGIFQSDRLQGYEEFHCVKVFSHGDLEINMLSMGDKHIFVEKRTFPPTADNPRGDTWIRRSVVYPNRKLAMTAYNLGKIQWVIDKVNEPEKVKEEPVVVGRSLNRIVI